MTLSEVAAETGNTRAGARRILLTLVREGYAVADGRLFDLTPQVLELGFSVLSSKGHGTLRGLLSSICRKRPRECVGGDPGQF
jgi:DNA-binding IclR family transcriptional regulator